MRVVYNTYPVAFDCPGGGEVQLRQSAAALTKRGLDIQLFDPWKPQLESADLVHFFSVQGGSMNFCSYVKNQRRLPLLISPVLWLTPENRPLLPLDEIRDLLHLCDQILPNSQLEARQLCKEFDLEPEKVTVVHNGVDESFAEPVSPDIFKNRFGIERPFLLNVANVEPRKNQLRLAQAAKSIGMDLVILGNVRDDAYHRACQDAAGSHWRWLGALDHASDILRSAYGACDLFVLPSLLETPGLAALEAAAAGAKVLVTKEGSTREYFAEYVTYVDPLSTREIQSGVVASLQKVCSSDLAKHVLSRFTWQNAARQLHEAYQTVLLQRQKGP
jgi:glycosyltransferase involved in cell wall biosynthesis